MDCAYNVVFMSWFNPSPDEAADEYYASRNRYNDAANQKYQSERQEEGYRSERCGVVNALNSCHSDKINFEKRLEDLTKIIGCMEGSGFIDVPGSIGVSNNSSEQADDSLRKSIQCDDIATPDFAGVFRCKSVEEETHSNNALNDFKKERERLKQAIEDLKNQINQLNAAFDNLSSQIAACNAQQAELRKVMVSSAFDMSHFKSYM
jgi:uncharacterized protein YlxW (UPF0749 family)